MIVCKEYEARISALIDDVLTIDERIEVLEHLDNCPACRAYWEDLLSLRDLLRTEETPAPVGFTDADMARVRERFSPSRSGSALPHLPHAAPLFFWGSGR